MKYTPSMLPTFICDSADEENKILKFSCNQVGGRPHTFNFSEWKSRTYRIAESGSSVMAYSRYRASSVELRI